MTTITIENDIKKEVLDAVQAILNVFKVSYKVEKEKTEFTKEEFMDKIEKSMKSPKTILSKEQQAEYFSL